MSTAVMWLSFMLVTLHKYSSWLLDSNQDLHTVGTLLFAFIIYWAWSCSSKPVTTRHSSFFRHMCPGGLWIQNNIIISSSKLLCNIKNTKHCHEHFWGSSDSKLWPQQFIKVAKMILKYDCSDCQVWPWQFSILWWNQFLHVATVTLRYSNSSLLSLATWFWNMTTAIFEWGNIDFKL